MGQAEILIAGLLVAVAGLSAFARRLSVPYPDRARGRRRPARVRSRVAAGQARPRGGAGRLPAAAAVRLVDLRELHRLPGLPAGLTLNAVALVLATMWAVAWAAHALIPGLSWEAAFVLGAIVSPTDPLAAATIMRRLDTPRRLLSAIEGEGLFNDATALLAYRVAVTAVVAGSFSLADAGL
jgi:hypothetical protein